MILQTNLHGTVIPYDILSNVIRRDTTWKPRIIIPRSSTIVKAMPLVKSKPIINVEILNFPEPSVCNDWCYVTK